MYSTINAPDNKTSDKCKATLAASAQQIKVLIVQALRTTSIVSPEEVLPLAKRGFAEMDGIFWAVVVARHTVCAVPLPDWKPFFYGNIAQRT